MTFDAVAFIREQTQIGTAPIVPEIKLHLATEVTPLWQMTEERLRQNGLPPPYWAFAWPGGQGVARYLLDHPEIVRGKKVLDFAAGCGIAAIAAMQAGAAQATAIEIDPMAHAATTLNAGINNVSVINSGEIDMNRAYTRADLIIAGDVCYQQAMSALLMRWLWLCVAEGVRVLIADPGRAYVPKEGLKECARYDVPTSRDLEDRDSRNVTVWELMPEFILEAQA